MRTVVTGRVGHVPVFNPRFLEYARARGLGVQACTPRRPTEKPYVERAIGFVRTRFWPGRHPADLFELNVQATKWRDDIANNRIHDDTGKVPSLVFKNEERARLEPVPTGYFDVDDLFTTSVSKTFRVDFDRNIYSVPWRLTNQQVLVRGNEAEVAVWLGPKRVAIHNWRPRSSPMPRRRTSRRWTWRTTSVTRRRRAASAPPPGRPLPRGEYQLPTGPPQLALSLD